LALHGSLRARYLLFRIAIRPEHAVLLHLWRGGRRAEIGVHVLPYDVAVARHLEEAAEVPFVDERVAVRQPLCARDARAEEIEHARLLVLPHDLVGRRIDLDDAREREALVETMRSVVENENVAVRQTMRRVLTGQRRRSELPDDLS